MATEHSQFVQKLREAHSQHADTSAKIERDDALLVELRAEHDRLASGATDLDGKAVDKISATLAKISVLPTHKRQLETLAAQQLDGLRLLWLEGRGVISRLAREKREPAKAKFRAAVAPFFADVSEFESAITLLADETSAVRAISELEASGYSPGVYESEFSPALVLPLADAIARLDRL